MSAFKYQISFSVVSHGQFKLMQGLLDDLKLLTNCEFELIVTLNIPENPDLYKSTNYPVKIIINEFPKGFGDNHNTAFSVSEGEFFAVINPDIRIRHFDLGEMLSPFSDNQVSVVAPQVYSPNGTIEDSARKFPTFSTFFNRIVLRRRKPDYQFCHSPYPVDWVAGMFIVFRKNIFMQINGFDDRRYFMYMEDVDICRRINDAGFKVILNPNVSVVHMAQRSSHKNFKHLKWHVTSIFRYLTGL